MVTRGASVPSPAETDGPGRFEKYLKLIRGVNHLNGPVVQEVDLHGNNSKHLNYVDEAAPDEADSGQSLQEERHIEVHEPDHQIDT